MYRRSRMNLDCHCGSVTMSLIQPSSRSKSSQKPSARRTENKRIYGHPLPIIFSEPSEPSFLRKTLHFFGVSVADILNPYCQGVLDVATRSVWVLDMKDAVALWQRGFFGKGDLSRSEPSWLARQINAKKLAKKGEIARTTLFPFSEEKRLTLA
jgi:tRNA-splicing endonuclease subunit Sen2